MTSTPHYDKLTAAIRNPKCRADAKILCKALDKYEKWVESTRALRSTKRERVSQMVKLLNEYKNFLEVDTIAKLGSPFLKRQKGQLKLDNSVLEEFLISLVDQKTIKGLPDHDLKISYGPRKTFLSLCFQPKKLGALKQQPAIVLKEKDQDFAIGRAIHYRFSTSPEFGDAETTTGELYLAILAAEIKVNIDKTMFQECAGTASRLKQGCPIARYYVLAEYLDMQPEDCRLTEIDNVFLLRKTTRLKAGKRAESAEIARQHKEFPIADNVIWNFVQEIQKFVTATWYEPETILKRGSFL